MTIGNVPFIVFFHVSIIAALALALAPIATAQSRRDGTGAAPPPVISQTIEMRRGAQVTVPLGIHGVRGEMLEFLIRNPPAHGRLSAVKNGGLNAATVTYTSSTRGKAESDRFAYAVRSSSGVSAPGTITIRFVEPVVAAAKLKAPTELEFPPVLPGQRSTVELELANEGGGMIEGEVSVPEPWSIEGLRIFRLAAGQRATFKVVFTPLHPGVRTGELIISGTTRKIIPLNASADVRLVATPALLKLGAQPGSQTRMGVLKIANHSDEDASVEVETSARLITDRIIKVPAHGTSTMPVFADATEVSAFDDALKLSSKEWTATVAVRAVAVGSILKFTAPEVSITGREGGADANGIAILENTGGEAATVRLDVGHPFDLESRVVTAPALGRVEIPISIGNSSAGTFASSLKATGEGGSAIVPVKADIAESAARQADVRAPAPPSEAEPPPSTEKDAPGENPAPLIPMTDSDIANALGKFARRVGKNTAALEWPSTLGPTENLRIEERVLSFSADGELQIGWSHLNNVTITPGTGQMTAELRGLKPGTFYTLRVVTLKDGEPSVLFTSDFWTVAKKPFFTGSLLTPLLVLALIVLLFAIWRSRHPKKA